MIKLLEQSQNESDEAIKSFLDSISKDADKIFNSILRNILKDVDVTKGKLQPNNDLINQVREYVIKATADSNYKANVFKFIDKAKDVGRTDIKINKELGNVVSAKVTDRLLGNTGVFTQGLTQGGYTVNVVNKVQSVVYQALYNNVSVVELSDNLQKVFEKTGDNTGDLFKYAKQVAQDSIYQYAGELNAGIADELGLNALIYTPNILIEGSRPICKTIIDKFNGTITNEELLVLLKKAGKEPKGFGAGMIEDTNTVSAFLKNRGGYNCIHKAYGTLV